MYNNPAAYKDNVTLCTLNLALLPGPEIVNTQK